MTINVLTLAVLILNSVLAVILINLLVKISKWFKNK